MNKKPRKLSISKFTPEDLDGLEKCRDVIAAELYGAGYSKGEVTMFLAGATLLGHLQDGGSKWGRIYLIQQHLADIQPFDCKIETAGRHKPDTMTPQDPYQK